MLMTPYDEQTIRLWFCFHHPESLLHSVVNEKISRVHPCNSISILEDSSWNHHIIAKPVQIDLESAHWELLSTVR